MKKEKGKKLHEEKGWGISKISHYLVAGKDNVSHWVKMSDNEINQDKRGWKKGKPRKYTNQQKKR